MERFFFDENEEKQILEAISVAEKNTSGEIRLHIQKNCAEDQAMARAIAVFEQLKMHKTKLKNGILFFLAVEDHSFAIIGDKGIDEKVPDDFWQGTKDLVLGHFKQGAFVQGLSEGIMNAGLELKKYFPYQSDDINELPDAISYDPS